MAFTGKIPTFIPIDIYREVIGQLFLDSISPNWLEREEIKDERRIKLFEDLLSCCLVSKEWLAITRPFLYLDIDLSCIDNLDALFNTLSLNPYIRPYVKHLSFPMTSIELLETKRHLFPCAQLSFPYDFDTDGSLIDGIPDSLLSFTRWERKIQLRKIVIASWQGRSWEPAARVLIRASEIFDLTQLEALEFSELPVGDTELELAENPKSSDLLEPLRRILLDSFGPKMQELKITTTSRLLLLLFLDSLPDLQRLSISADLANMILNRTSYPRLESLQIMTDPDIEPSPIQEHPDLLFSRNDTLERLARAFPLLRVIGASPYMSEQDIYADAELIPDEDLFAELEEEDLISMEQRRDEMRECAVELKEVGVTLVDQWGVEWLKKPKSGLSSDWAKDILVALTDRQDGERESAMWQLPKILEKQKFKNSASFLHLPPLSFSPPTLLSAPRLPSIRRKNKTIKMSDEQCKPLGLMPDSPRPTRPYGLSIFPSTSPFLLARSSKIGSCDGRLLEAEFIFVLRFRHFRGYGSFGIMQKHCWQNFVDYHKCINAKGEDYAPCKQFKRTYRSLCPNDWIEKWDNQIEEGKFPADLSP
ncbi:cytochrome c subunit vib [Phaffia rhodozyma]|uniref:Cytochrome c subunit vib n=1 Tax=Phaffia rhodozyma TaxID=264483 RepID=A0A0F7SPZ3_PHARH|nr:cytochrome c subunit vib [Phaffia rhodozyma]